MNQDNEKSVNAVTVSGTLQTAEIRRTGKGDAVSNATLVVVDGWKDGNAKQQWLRIVLWRGLAERAAKLSNSKVRITGRIETTSWQDKETGEKKYRNQIVADSLEPIQSLQEIPTPKEETKEKQSSRTPNGRHVAAAILRPHSSAITPEHPIGDDDLPF